MNILVVWLARGIALLIFGFAIRLFFRYVLGISTRQIADAVGGKDLTDAPPFSEAEYAENKAESQDWELQQALRRAAMLEKKGKLAEAVKILTTVRNTVKDPHAREVLDQEIRRLGGTPPAAPAAPAPVKKEEHDPYAERME